MDAIILAAGYSSRAKTDKTTLIINGKTVLSQIIETFHPFCENLIVVGGHYYDATKNLVKQYPQVILVKNNQYGLGMFTSIKAGVKETSSDFFVMPGDIPLVSQITCEKMIKYFMESKQRGFDLLIPTYNGKRGHPILFHQHLKEPLLNESDESNLRVFRDRYQIDHLAVDDAGVLMDIDTMEDYKRIIQF